MHARTFLGLQSYFSPGVDG